MDRMILCSFAGGAAKLKGRDRTPDNILAALALNPRVSCFDLSENAWLRDMISALEKAGLIHDDRKEPYPWVRYTFTKDTQP